LYQAQISAAPLHYKDVDGNWQEIDTRPVARPGGGFEVTANNAKMVFPETLDQNGVEVNATLYPAPSEEAQPPVSDKVKPDAATMFQDSASAGKARQGSPLELSLKWKPQHLAYANESGPVSSSFVTGATSATTVESGVEYAQAFDNATLTFVPLATGFVQRLELTALSSAGGSGGATKLEYAVHVTLPSDTQLYSRGVPQTGDFTTDVLELRDEAGNSLLVVPAPRLYDEVVSRSSPRTQYRIERTSDGFNLIAELPLEWLLDPDRRYPVIAESSAILPLDVSAQDIAFWQDTWMWECSPTGGLNQDVVWVGHFASGCSPGAERALTQWMVDLPADAMILDPTESQLWRLPANDVGTGVETIGTQRMLLPWSYVYANWLDRTSTSSWTQPGAENDYLVSPEDVVAVPSGGSEGYISMGSLPSLIGAWHTDQYFYPWGDANYGVMYKSTSESGPDSDRSFAQIGPTSPISVPILSVTYFTDFYFLPDPDVDYYVPRAPSPDYLRIGSESRWRAVGIRPLDERSDYDLFLSSSTSYTSSILAGSVELGSAPDFVVINPDVSATYLYPWAIQWEGTGLYYFRYPIQSQELAPGGPTVINSTAYAYTVISIYQVDMTAGDDYQIALDVTSGDADLGMALFAPSAAGGSDYMNRHDAIALADSAGYGGSETMDYAPEVSGLYGLVVWNNGATQHSNYSLSLLVQAPSAKVYLPISMKSYEPAAPEFANGGFETGTFPPWISAGPGSPMVASVIGNPESGCFSGSFTAQLGTPGKLSTIPLGEVKVEQWFRVPSGASQITFKYRAYSYDVIQGCSSGRYYDRFEVTVNGNPVRVDGNPACSSDGQTLWQSGCQSVSIPISEYAGKNVTLKFSVYNLTFPSYNTWAYVDDVRVQ
jgi:hypothetical protein